MNDLIIRILRESCALPEEEVFESSVLSELSLDSLSFIDALVKIEEISGIEFDMEELDMARWERVEDIIRSVEEKKNAEPLTRANLKKPLFLIIGGEKRGISASTLSLADQRVCIEYGRPFAASLSAASAASILAFEILRQNPTNA